MNSINYLKTEAEELPGRIGQTVCLHGMIYKLRRMSGFDFLVLQTKRRLVQCIVSRETKTLQPLKENMAVLVRGRPVTDPRSAAGVELHADQIEILSVPEGEPPVVINNRELPASIDTLLDYRPLTLRNIKQRAIFKIQEGLCDGFREYLRQKRFTEIHSPKIVFSGAEGGSNIFTIDYFGREAYLTQSPQFYKQMMVGVFERVYEIAPVFRAEKHDTSRHINEYTSVDLEIGFIESFTEIMQIETAMIRQAMEYLRSRYEPELTLLEVQMPQIEEIPAVRFSDAKEMVRKVFHRLSEDEEDLDPEEEQLICKLIKEQTGSDFVFITHYKSSKRPFYAMDSKENPLVTESFDLLFRGMEVTTGGQRIHDYRQQVQKMLERGMNPDNFSGYLMAHKFGLPPHGGLGLGLERFTARLLGYANVRSATLFPRDIHRLEP